MPLAANVELHILKRQFHQSSTLIPKFSSVTYAHRLDIESHFALTLFFTIPKERESGFLCPKGWVHCKHFTDSSGQKKGAAYAEVSLRLSSGIYLMLWGFLKLGAKDKAVGVSDKYYDGLLSGDLVNYSVGAIEMVIGLLVVLGLFRGVAYLAVGILFCRCGGDYC